MLFKVVGTVPLFNSVQEDTVYLVRDGWDDWFQFSTLFDVVYVDLSGTATLVGQTKIGEFGLLPASRIAPIPEGHRSPQLPQEFSVLGSQHFSLGQDTSYYENLANIGEDFRDRFLHSIHDIAYDSKLLERAELEHVTAVSLLRDVPLRTVRDQFTRLARGELQPTSYNLAFNLSSQPGKQTLLTFSVRPGSRPPTNIHVLIGRNGVGKSRTLNRLARAIVALSKPSEEAETEHAFLQQISNVVSVSFSAFDVFAPISNPRDRNMRLAYHYIGLKKIDPKDGDIKGAGAISREFTFALKTCLLGAARLGRLRRALSLLESDPIFAESGLGELLQEGDSDSVLDEAPSIFREFSSGHKIVLLTIAKLVETVEEKSLVLIDEPEAHLHPPLLSAFVRALSDLLTNRNGMAIVATHSPVVLQEVPSSCVWKLHRWGEEVTAERPLLETFGENVGTLTDEVFGLEVTATGFHKMLSDVAENSPTYENALSEFDGQLGSEGRAMLRAMFLAASRGHHVGS